MKRFCSAWTIVVLIALTISCTNPTVGHSQTFDFGTSANEEASRSVSELKQEAETLWRGKAEYLQFETALLRNQLLFISATSTNLSLNLGTELDPLRTEFEKRMPGKILLIDAHSLPDRPRIAVLSVTYLTGDRFKTSVFVVRSEDGRPKLREFEESNWRLIRPVGGWMMAQQYDPESLWQQPINYLTTKTSGYVTGESVPLPDSARLMSLLKLTDEQWVYINKSGDLILTDGKEILSTISGEFGATPTLLRPIRNSWKRQNLSEPVRLSPEYIPSKEWLAVMENPSAPSGLLGWFSRRNEPSTIKLFSTEGSSIGLLDTIGPFPGDVFDVEVSPANPHQLLWLRRNLEGNVVLEMLDLNEL
jgi:hypothetical protein